MFHSLSLPSPLSFRSVWFACSAAFVGLSAAQPSLRAAAPAEHDRDRARLQVVVAYADNVLKDAADRYRPEPSPLLANGINVFTKEPLRWVFADKSEAVISDLTMQQNFLRVLSGLTNLTGDPRYRAVAKAQFAYHFAHFQDVGGLMQWGGHRFVDLRTLAVVGPSGKDMVHELKNVFPYYELMYEVNPAATARFITGFWNAHVFNWRTLEISRHGQYGQAPGAHWENPFDDPAPFFETKGLSFLDAGNDLIYSAAMLYRLSGDQGALRWSKRLAAQYVKARDPRTGLGAYQYTEPRKTASTDDDSITLSWYGDRAKRQFGPDFPGHRVIEGTMLLRRLATSIYSENALMQWQLAQTLGSDGREFRDWTRDGLAAFARRAYMPETNQFRPMLTDGTDLTGHVLQRNGYYGKAGRRLDPYPATPEFMIAYARGFMLTGDATLWAIARGIAQASGLGDLGTAPGRDVAVNLATDNNDVFALFSLLDIHRQTRIEAYLQLARVIGDNVIRTRWHHGYFTPNEDQIFANIDALEPYALLALDAAIKGKPESVPDFINGSGFLDGEYRFLDGQVRGTKDATLFRPRKSISPVPVPAERDPNGEHAE
jgi:pectate lyase